MTGFINLPVPSIMKTLKNRLNKNARSYLYTGTLTAILTVLLFLKLGIYPFGDNTLAYSDGDQYLSVSGYLQSCFFTDNNLLFSWSKSLGGNMLSTFAYYSASPFNLLLAFFPGNLLLGYHAVFCLKMIFASLSFAALLNLLWEQADERAVMLFSVSYPFMGYVAAFAWNPSWMDGIILLPMVLAGIVSIVRRQKVTLYIVALFLALFSNFYIGYMICIASVILFLAVFFLKFRKIDNMALKSAALYIGGSVIAAGLAAVLLLPTYFGLPEGRNYSFLQLFKDMEFKRMPADILSMMYGNGHNIGLGNLPFIYVGILQFVLIVSFFLNKAVSKRLKAVSGAIIALFALSFSNTMLDTIWHGMSSNAWFNHRYSFILSFVLELIAFCSFMHISKMKKRLPAAGICMAGLTLFVMVGQDQGDIDPPTLLIAAAMAIVALLLLHGHAKLQKNGRMNSAILALLALLAFGSLFGNSAASMEGQVQSRTASRYKELCLAEGALREAASGQGDGFYRRASAKQFGRSDAMLFGFPGVQNYVSTENREILDFCREMGILSPWWTSYNNNVPLSTDTLLGIKYIISEPSSRLDHYISASQVRSQDKTLCVMENPHALPLIFPVEGGPCPAEEGENIFLRLNRYWNSVTEAGGDIFYTIPYSVNIEQADEEKYIHIYFTAAGDGPVYAHIPGGEGISINDAASGQRLDYNMYQDVIYVGTFAKGDEGEFVMRTPASYDRQDGIAVCGENTDTLFLKADSVLQKGIHVEMESSSHLSMAYHADQDEMLASTILYDPSWHISIDGEEIPVKRNMGLFLAFDYPAGSHEIQLTYKPKGFLAGRIISGCSFLLFLMILVYERKGLFGQLFHRSFTVTRH